MSLRTRLIIAFLLLSVVPLSAVTFFTYLSWVETFESAARREASQSAADIGRRMERITSEVGRRMDRLFLGTASAVGTDGASGMRQRVAPTLGDTAALVERVEFHPDPAASPSPSPAPSPSPGSDRPAPPLPPAPPGAKATSASAHAAGPPAPAPGVDGRRFGRRGGRGGRPWGPPPPGAAPPAPQVIVVDVQQALEEARRGAHAGVAAVAPDLAPMIDAALSRAMPAAETALQTIAKAQQSSIRAAEAKAREGADRAAEAEAEALARVQAQVQARTQAHEHAQAQAKAQAEADAKMQMSVQGRRVEIAVKQGDKVIGKANAMLNLDRTLQTVFAFARRDLGEIPFAIDTRGALHNPDPDQRRTLESFGAAALGPAAARDGSPRRAGDWLVVARKDPSGLIFGIARPIGESLRDIRRAAVKNLSLGLLVIVLALVGIVPISHRMTRHLTTLSAGVRQLSAGDFNTRVPVKTRDEFGALAAAFNQMAEDLQKHQTLVIEQERLRRELELSRLIQTEMLPRNPLRLGAAEIKGVSIPAREVGGDFFNYFALPDGRLALLVGDVSGKGVSAALLMANVQATLRARLGLEADLAQLAATLDREIDETTPGAVYLTLFLGILDAERHELRYVNAGHNPQFVIHAGGGVDAMPATGLPIALYAGQPYSEAVVPVRGGDLIFFYTDGLPEAENEGGDQFGLERLQAILAEEQTHGIDEVLARVEAAVSQFRGKTEPLDDATMMALRLNG